MRTNVSCSDLLSINTLTNSESQMQLRWMRVLTAGLLLAACLTAAECRLGPHYQQGAATALPAKQMAAVSQLQMADVARRLLREEIGAYPPLSALPLQSQLRLPQPPPPQQQMTGHPAASPAATSPATDPLMQLLEGIDAGAVLAALVFAHALYKVFNAAQCACNPEADVTNAAD